LVFKGIVFKIPAYEYIAVVRFGGYVYNLIFGIIAVSGDSAALCGNES